MYKLLLYSNDDCIIIDHIDEVEVLKAIKLFDTRHGQYRVIIYQYQSCAEYEDEYFQVLSLWR